jgi:hypothetical protein
MIGTASAMSITPIRYNETAPAGSTIGFNVSLIPTTTDEKVIDTVSIEGDCSEWINITPASPQSLPATFTVQGTIPTNATNGRTRCDIGFQQPAAGMISMAIGFPITFDVTGGMNATPIQNETPTATTTDIIISTTETPPPPPPAPTTETTPEPKVTYSPMSEWLGLAGIAGALIYRRYRR